MSFWEVVPFGGVVMAWLCVLASLLTLLSVRRLKKWLAELADQQVLLCGDLVCLSDSVSDLASQIALAESRWRSEAAAEAEANRMLQVMASEDVSDVSHLGGAYADVSALSLPVVEDDTSDW